MSLPNDGGDDDYDPTAHRLFMKGGIPSSPSSEDETAIETSIGSNSVVSGAPSTVVTVPDDGTIRRSRVASNNTSIQNLDVQTQRRRYQRQLRSLGLATGAALVFSAVSIIPTPLLMAMIILIGVAAALIQKLIQILTFELQLLLQGRGIGDYLPPGLYEQLTRTSFHELMSDRSMINENAYVMLYFIPGLSRDQIDEYVGRLAPRHQELLHRQGLGFMLGDTFMRFLMGDQRLRPALEEQEEQVYAYEHGSNAGGSVSAATPVLVPRRLELPPTIPEEGVADETSELGEEEDPAAQYARFWGAEPVGHEDAPSSRRDPAQSSGTNPVAGATSTNAYSPASVVGREVSVAVAARNTGTSAITTTQRRTAPSSAPPSQEEIAAVAQAEEQVIYDAIGSAVTTYMGIAASMVHASARQSATLFSGTIFRASMGVTMLSVGVGIYGFWTGAYNPQTFFQPTWRMLQSQMASFLRPPRALHGGWHLPESQVLIASTAASGATAGIMLLFQMASRKKDENDKKAAAAASRDSKKHLN